MVVSESSKLKDNISKNIDLNKKIAKLDAEGGAKLYEEKKKQTEKKLEEEKKQQTEKPVNVKKDIITKKTGCGFYDIHQLLSSFLPATASAVAQLLLTLILRNGFA